MANGKTKQDFIEFLDYLGQKGLVPSNTAVGRKAAAQKVFAVLSSEEALDMTKVDIDEVMHRFENLNRGKYTTDSLRSYQSRLRNSLQEFADFCDNPLSFKPKRRLKVVVKTRPKVDSTSDKGTVSAGEAPKDEQLTTVNLPSAAHVLPIALRPNLTVQIAGLPFDLTRPEAQKLANIILAHAIPEQ
jgi:hypothetical protein